MRLIVTLLVLLSLLPGCSNRLDRDAVMAVAIKRQQALTTKDINLYLTLLSPHYQDKGLDYAAKSRELKETLSSFDRIDYRSHDRRVDVKGDRATVTGSYGLRVVRQGKEIGLEGKEELLLLKEAGEWKIVGGL